MSELFVDTVKTQDGTKSISMTNVVDNLAETDVRYAGSAKAWVNFDGTGTIHSYDSFNFSSLTDNGTGDYTVTFSNSFANANYGTCLGVEGFIRHVSLDGFVATSSFKLDTFSNVDVRADGDRTMAAVFGDLA